jgi:hypothetical protein
MNIKTLRMIKKLNSMLMLFTLLIVPIIVYGFIVKEPFAIVVSIMSLSALCTIKWYRSFGNVLIALLTVVIAQLFRFVELARNERLGYTFMLAAMFLFIVIREYCSFNINKIKKEAQIEAWKHSRVEGYCNHPNLNTKAEGYASHTNACSHASGEAVPYEKMFPNDAKITHVKEKSKDETTV